MLDRATIIGSLTARLPRHECLRAASYLREDLPREAYEAVCRWRT